MRFEILLKIISFLLVGKSKITLEFPRQVFRGVGRLAIVVVSNPLFQIRRGSNIEFIRIGRAADDINIVHNYLSSSVFVALRRTGFTLHAPPGCARRSPKGEAWCGRPDSNRHGISSNGF